MISRIVALQKNGAVAEKGKERKKKIFINGDFENYIHIHGQSQL